MLCMEGKDATGLEAFLAHGKLRNRKDSRAPIGWTSGTRSRLACGHNTGGCPTGRHVVAQLLDCRNCAACAHRKSWRLRSVRPWAFVGAGDRHPQRPKRTGVISSRMVIPISHVRQKRAHQFGILQRFCSCKEHELCYSRAPLGFFATLRLLGLHRLALVR